MFRPEDAREAFIGYLDRCGVDSGALPLRESLAALMDFYRDERADSCLFEYDGDMLLFEWGTFDWGQGEHFSFSLTRQLIFGDAAEDEDIWQLRLGYEFAPTDELKRLDAGNRWCASLDELAEFRDAVMASEAFAKAVSSEARSAEIRYFCAG